MRFVAAGLLIATGCGTDDGLGKRYSVSGTVVYKGQPLPKGNISFLPEDPNGRAANGVIEDGNYSLTTLTEGDGALPGTYRVTVIAKETKPVGLTKYGGAPSQREVAKVNKVAKSLVPAKYADFTTTDLKAEVKEQSNTIPFDLSD